jgi:hypothetical protein
MANNKVQKRKYVIGLLVLLAMATVSTYAWSTDEQTADPTKVYVTGQSSTTATIGTVVSKPVGKNQIKITVPIATAAATNGIDFMFVASNGTVIKCNRDVKWDGGSAITPDSDGIYSVAGSIATGSYAITITRTAAQATASDVTTWKDLRYGTAGLETFDGIMIVIK